MSLNRLRRLAGLNESFTNDPRVNSEIEQKLINFPSSSSSFVMDILEAIYDAGVNGASIPDIIEHMMQIHVNEPTGNIGVPNSSVASRVKKILPIIATPERFGNLIENRNGMFYWRPTNVEDEVDPSTRQAIGSQVEMTSEALKVMRDLTQSRGSFTEMDLAKSLAQTSGLPLRITTEFANHAIGQFQSMLNRVGNGYAMKQEKVNTRDDSMQLFKDLEAGARKNPRDTNSDE